MRQGLRPSTRHQRKSSDRPYLHWIRGICNHLHMCSLSQMSSGIIRIRYHTLSNTCLKSNSISQLVNILLLVVGNKKSYLESMLLKTALFFFQTLNRLN
jgi:hypothetical protein